jgi:acyl-CoA thioester hydrolase
MAPAIETEELVRYSEIDQMGVAHNKVYFEWFELGRTEFCRRKGLPYKEIEALGFYLVVVEAFCKYRRPLHYDQAFLIRVSLRESTAKKFVFDYELLTKEERTLIASGYTTHIVINRRGEVADLPEEVRARIAADNGPEAPRPDRDQER